MMTSRRVCNFVFICGDDPRSNAVIAESMAVRAPAGVPVRAVHVHFDETTEKGRRDAQSAHRQHKLALSICTEQIRRVLGAGQQADDALAPLPYVDAPIMLAVDAPTITHSPLGRQGLRDMLVRALSEGGETGLHAHVRVGSFSCVEVRVDLAPSAEGHLPPMRLLAAYSSAVETLAHLQRWQQQQQQSGDARPNGDDEDGESGDGELPLLRRRSDSAAGEDAARTVWCNRVAQACQRYQPLAGLEVFSHIEIVPPILVEATHAAMLSVATSGFATRDPAVVRALRARLGTEASSSSSQLSRFQSAVPSVLERGRCAGNQALFVPAEAPLATSAALRQMLRRWLDVSAAVPNLHRAGRMVIWLPMGGRATEADLLHSFPPAGLWRDLTDSSGDSRQQAAARKCPLVGFWLRREPDRQQDAGGEVAGSIHRADLIMYLQTVFNLDLSLCWLAGLWEPSAPADAVERSVSGLKLFAASCGVNFARSADDIVQLPLQTRQCAEAATAMSTGSNETRRAVERCVSFLRAYDAAPVPDGENHHSPAQKQQQQQQQKQQQQPSNPVSSRAHCSIFADEGADDSDNEDNDDDGLDEHERMIQHQRAQAECIALSRRNSAAATRARQLVASDGGSGSGAPAVSTSVHRATTVRGTKSFAGWVGTEVRTVTHRGAHALAIPELVDMCSAARPHVTTVAVGAAADNSNGNADDDDPFAAASSANSKRGSKPPLSGGPSGTRPLNANLQPAWLDNPRKRSGAGRKQGEKNTPAAAAAPLPGAEQQEGMLLADFGMDAGRPPLAVKRPKAPPPKNAVEKQPQRRQRVEPLDGGDALEAPPRPQGRSTAAVPALHASTPPPQLEDRVAYGGRGVTTAANGSSSRQNTPVQQRRAGKAKLNATADDIARRGAVPSTVPRMAFEDDFSDGDHDDGPAHRVAPQAAKAPPQVSNTARAAAVAPASATTPPPRRGKQQGAATRKEIDDEFDQLCRF